MKDDLLRTAAFGPDATRSKTTVLLPGDVADALEHICNTLGVAKNAVITLAVSETIAKILSQHGDFIGTDADRRLILGEICDRVVAVTRAVQ